MNLNELIKDATSIPSIPKVAQELMEYMAGSDVKVTEAAKKLKLDQALSAKVLRMANSAKYARSRTFESVDEAAIVVGLDALRTMIISSGIASAFSGSVDMKALWRESFMHAEATKYLAGELQLSTETGFTVGLLHNIGEILIAAKKPEMYKYYQQEKKHKEEQTRLENRVYGFTSVSVGAQLASHWKFPTAVANAIAYQNAPGEAEGDATWAELLHLSKGLIRAFEGGSIDEFSKSDANRIAQTRKINIDTALEVMAKCQEDTESYLALLD